MTGNKGKCYHKPHHGHKLGQLESVRICSPGAVLPHQDHILSLQLGSAGHNRSLKPLVFRVPYETLAPVAAGAARSTLSSLL